jgi:hypothetical protein
MNYLQISLKKIDESTSELFATVAYNGFSGMGSCYVDVSRLRDDAKRFSLYPIPDDKLVCIEGGYLSEDATTLIQTHLHISVVPKDALGNLVLRINLAVPEYNDVYEFKAAITCEVPVSYEQMNDFSNAMVAIAENTNQEYKLYL